MTSPGPTPDASRKAARTRQRILAATARELARHGYGGTSLRSVAAGAGLQQGSLYFHFPSKDELVAAALREGIDFAYDHVQQALDALPAATATPELRLRTAIRAHLEALHDNPDHGSAIVSMVGTLPAEVRGTHLEHERRYARLWLRILGDAREAGLLRSSGELRLTRDLFIGALNGTLNMKRSRDSLEPLADAAFALVTGTGPAPGRPAG